MVTKRHFVVHRTDDSYSLKEITADIADSIHRYGVTTIEHVCQDGERCVFYFMNASFNGEHHRRNIIERLVHILPEVQ